MPKPREPGRLLVVGNVTEDLAFRVPDLPRPGETLICEARSEDLGGKGLNQAVVAARCGIAVTLLAPVGRDVIAERVRALAETEELAADLPDVTDRSDQSVIAVARSGENTIISSAIAADALPTATAVARVDGFGPGDAILVQGNLSREVTQAVLSAARNQGMATFANPSPIRWDWGDLWPLVDTVILNRLELETLAGMADADAGIAALRRAGCGRALLTLGAEGAFLADATGQWRQAAVAAQVVDTAGAGDTFCGVFLARDLRGDAPGVALERAARAAAITVSRPGTHSAFPDAAALRTPD